LNQNIEKLINLLEQKKYQQAYDHITQIQQVPLINAKIAYDIATCLFTLKKYDELASVVQQVETQNPKNPHLFSLYILLAAREDIDNIHIKLRYLRKAIQLNPNDFTAYYNIGCHLKNRHKDKMAKKFFKLAQERASDKAEIYLNLGLIAEVEAQGKKEENYYLKAIALQPDLIEAHLNLGMCYLNSENYQQGWSEYEWRLQLSGLNNMPQIYQKPCWQGESLENKTLLIVCEQGYGDAIQFARYIPLIQKSNNKILLRCRQPLKALMQTVKGLDQCFTSDEASPVYDYYCPLLSLPKIFNTNAKTIPVNVPYFSIETKRKKHWQNYFKRFKNTFNIGINWSGNIHNKINYYRKTTPDKFAQ